MLGTMYVYRPSPTTQWAPADLRTDSKSELATATPEDPSPHPHMAPLPLPGGFADTWRATLGSADYFQWLASSKSPLPTSVAPCRPSLPDHSVDYDEVTERLRALLRALLLMAVDSGPQEMRISGKSVTPKYTAPLTSGISLSMVVSLMPSLLPTDQAQRSARSLREQEVSLPSLLQLLA
jgi:hypothetical protein